MKQTKPYNLDLFSFGIESEKAYFLVWNL